MKRIATTSFIGVIGMAACCVVAQTTKPTNPQPRVTMAGGRLQITAEPNGDRMVDFSNAGYAGGNAPIPTVPTKVLVRPLHGDATALIQAAIEQVGALPADGNGFRGAVLLAPGKYTISGQIRLDRSGVVLRGSGVAQTILVAAGYDRRPLICVGGRDDRTVEASHDITDPLVPAGSNSFTAPGHGLKIGDSVLVTRPCTEEWTVALGMNDMGGDRHGMRWSRGSRVLTWDRTVTGIEGNRVALDVAITCALDQRFGGGKVARYAFPGRVTQAGVENLTCDSAFDQNNPKDEDHAWLAVTINHAADAWVRRVNAQHFVSSAVAVQQDAKCVTVEDCRSLAPVGEPGGWRRRAFLVEGQQVLMQRLWSENAEHDFAVGFAAAGPNAFVECESRDSIGDSGAIDSWAAGALFDRVRIDGANLSLKNLAYVQKGAGWSAVNSVLWNSSAGVIECWSPPMAQNYAVGTRGEFSGDGIWWASDDQSPISSLYYAQLGSRSGADAARRSRFVQYLPEGSRRTTPEMSANLVRLTREPQKSVSDLIDEVAAADPIPEDQERLAAASVPTPKEAAPVEKLTVRNGWLVAGDRIVTGRQAGVPWWNSGVRPPQISESTAITRFVPGEEGTGFTDRIDEVVAGFVQQNIAALVQHPPLWYDRRRDDHQRVRRSDAEVVPPFYEWPFARSGQGRAYDGLSKWDLTRPNRYYYLRMREFADLAAQRGIVLFDEHYMQHNIIEAGAHYVDFPWRPANNVNDTGLPEPVAFAGDKLIYMGENFYDVTNNPRIRALHRQYIRRQLEEMKDSPNVVHLTSEEFTGSLQFVQFWLDTIAEWETETGRHALVGLYATKDVTDAILADEVRAKVVDVIYSRFNSDGMGFWYSAGKLFAPPGGQNLSPRQWTRLGAPGTATASDVVRMVSEYRTKYPDKAFAYAGNDLGAGTWDALIAGMSMANMRIDNADLARAIPQMKPAGPHVLADRSHMVLAFVTDHPPKLPLDAGKTYSVQIIDPKSGRTVETRKGVDGAQATAIPAAEFTPYLLWLKEETADEGH